MFVPWRNRGQRVAKLVSVVHEGITLASWLNSCLTCWLNSLTRKEVKISLRVCTSLIKWSWAQESEKQLLPSWRTFWVSTHSFTEILWWPWWQHKGDKHYFFFHPNHIISVIHETVTLMRYVLFNRSNDNSEEEVEKNVRLILSRLPLWCKIYVDISLKVRRGLFLWMVLRQPSVNMGKTAVPYLTSWSYSNSF